MTIGRVCLSLAVLAGATLFCPSKASAQLVGPQLLASYEVPTDTLVQSVLVVYSSYSFSAPGAVDYFESNVQPTGNFYGPLTTLLLRPAGGNDYTVEDAQTFTVPAGSNPGYQYDLTTPWTVQAGDVYATFGNGIPFTDPPFGGDTNAVDSVFVGTPVPSANTTITLPGSYASYTGDLRDYGMDAHLIPSASSTPEPGVNALLAGFGAASLSLLARRRRQGR